MKRCVSVALILALFGINALSPALAEDMDVVAEAAEASVVEVNAIDSTVLETEDGAPTESIEGEIASTTEATEAPAPEGTSAPANAAVTEIRLNQTAVSIGVGEKYAGLAVVTAPEGSALPAVAWRSANKKIAKVNAATGVVTGVKKGSTTVYAKLADSDIELKCKVTVKAKPGKVSASSASMSLSAGMTGLLKATLPKGTASGKLTWSSSKPTVAAVDESGAITAIKVGSATITVKTYNGKKASCKVKVLAAPAAVAFPAPVVPMAVGQTAAAKATALTAKGVETPAAFTYAIDADSPDAGCVTVNAATGELKAVRKGQAILQAITHNCVVGRCEIDVDVAPKAVALSASSVTLGVKEVCAAITAELTPPDGAESCAQVVKWASANSKIAKVDASTGVITGVKAGSTTITAATPNGKTARCKVKVMKAPTSVSISPSVGALEVGSKGQFKVKLPSGCGGGISYASSNATVATVDGSGVVTAIAPGTAKITVTTYNGKSKTAELVVGGGAVGESGSKSGSDEKIAYLLAIARTKLGKPYVYGSFGPNSFDCSGFVYWCFKQINVKLKDSAYKQGYDTGYPIVAYSQLLPGDLVFFDTEKDSDLSDHSGIFLGNGQFIHASSSAKKVIVSSLASGYYQRTFSWGRRVLN